MTTPQGNGNCGPAAVQAASDFPGGIAKVCHGYPTGQGKIEGVVFWHAWVEVGSLVIDQSNGSDVIMDQKSYYELGQIDPQHVTKYSTHESDIAMTVHGHYGPWEPEPAFV